MKKILTSIATIAVVSLAVVSATGAFFSDSATSTVSTVTSGTLALDVNNNDSASTYTWNLADELTLSPGESTGPVSITIKNAGTTDLAWFGYFNLTGPDAGWMSEAIYIKEATMEFLNPVSGTWEPTDHYISNGTGFGPYASYYVNLANSDPMGVISLKSWNADNAMGVGGGVQKGAIKPGYSYRLTLEFGMAPKAGNEYQNKIMGVSYTVDATQVDADALASLFADKARLTGDPDLTWLNQQIAKQD